MNSSNLHNFYNDFDWEFSEASCTDVDRGVGPTEGHIFKGDKYENVIRETAQNGADAAIEDLNKNKQKVKMVYEVIEVEQCDIPSVSKLIDVIEKGTEYLKKDNVKTDEIDSLQSACSKYLKSNKKIKILKISDYNTVGLNEDRFEKLLRSSGITNKCNGDSGGSFGFGKYASFLLSPINTVLYSSRTENHQYIFQGICYFPTFEDNGKRMKGNGIFGRKNIPKQRVDPLKKMEDVPEIFRRNKSGTDIYILCFEGQEKKWIDEMVFHTLENFFYAIYIDRLEFEFKEGDTNIKINKSNLGNRINEYNDKFKKSVSDGDLIDAKEFTAPKYWNVLTNKNTKKFIENIENKGEIEIDILTGEGIEGHSVLEMRSLGMKIMEDSRFRQITFNAILYVTGKNCQADDYKNNINKLLLKTEGPAHNSWDINNIQLNDDEFKKLAKKILNKIHEIIRNKVNDLLPQNSDGSIDVYGLNKILPSKSNDDEKYNLEESAYSEFRPKPIKIRETQPIKRNTREPLHKSNLKKTRKNNYDQISKNSQKKYNSQTNENHSTHLKRTVMVNLKKIATPYNIKTGQYQITLIPEIDADPLMVRVDICSENSVTKPAVIINASQNNNQLVIKNGLIFIPKVKRNAPLAFACQLSSNEPYALEVNAYAEK